MTNPSIRRARPGDHAAIAAFTSDTFDWGDYVADRFVDWLAAEDSAVFVAVGEDDVALAVSRVVQLSPREVWLHAARVHRDHQRRGIGRALNDESAAWGARRGAVVAGLLTEDDNTAARAQVAKLGYREVAHWFYGSRSIDPGERDPAAIGVSPAQPPQPLNAAPAVDIEPAYATWSASELATAAHGLFAIGWSMRRMSIDDLATAVGGRRLYEAPAGWVMMDQVADGGIRIPWIVTIADDAYSFIRAITARIAAEGHTRAEMLLPNVSWLVAAAQRAGYSIHPNTVWHRQID